MRITQLPEATAYEDGMFFAVAKAGAGTFKMSTKKILSDLTIVEDIIQTNFDANNAENNSIYKIQTNSDTVINIPTETKTLAAWYLITLQNTANGNVTKQQYLINDLSTIIYSRYYWNGWSNWVRSDDSLKVISNIIQTNFDANNAEPNRIYKIQTNSDTVTNIPTETKTLAAWYLITLQNKANGNVTKQQFLINDLFTIIYSRYYWNGWSNWVKNSNTSTPIIECGTGKQYTRLRDAIAAGIQTKGSKVVVYPGVYDLTDEFSTELTNHSGSGILLTNDVHVIFMPGSFVTCLVDVSNTWAYQNFEPFRVDEGNFILENIDISCKNTRYCVHDELGGKGTYKHTFINCKMHQLDENELAYYHQCIGGGLGEHGYIEIIGGRYKSESLYYLPQYEGVDDMQQPITYHNGNNANAYGNIVIRDVYLENKGYFRFGCYGSSNQLTPVQISGCRMYKEPMLMAETWSPSQVINFELITYNNEVVTE